MDMLRVTALWSGFPGAPGYSNFFFAGGGGLISDAQQVAQRVADAFAAVAPRLPVDVTIQVEQAVEVIDSDTGMTTDFREISTIPPVVGSGGASYAGPTGAVVNWRTNDLRNGRRIRGRTFLVPLSTASFATDGTLSEAAREDVQDFAAVLIGGDLDSELGVWSRPIGGAGGVFATVVSSTVPDMAAVLRSRRD